MIFSWFFLTLLGSYIGLIFIFPKIALLHYVILGIVIFWLIDWLITTQEQKLTAFRSFDKPVYQHQETTVTVVINNPLNRTLMLLVRDEPPFEVNIKGKAKQLLTVKPFGSCEFTYQITGDKRGCFNFGNLNLRYSGRLRLFTYQYQINLEEALPVFPNLNKIGDYRFGQQTKTELSGIHRQRIFSMSGEFSQLRDFVTGDDYRKINWKVSAHYGKPIVNEYEPEKDQNIFLCFDSGRMLFDQVDSNNNRMDCILDSALYLAYNIVIHGDMVGAISFNSKVDRYIPIGKGKTHLKLLVNQLYDLQAEMLESDYREAFRFLNSRINKRSLFFIYTDINDPESARDLINYLKILSKHHLVVCVLLKKECLTELTDSQIIDETTAYLKSTALELLAEREKLIRILSLNNIKILEVEPGNISQTVVQHYLLLKQKGLI